MLFHPEFTPEPPDWCQPNKRHFDIIPSSTADSDTDHETTDPAVNLTSRFSGNTTSSLRHACWLNYGMLHLTISWILCLLMCKIRISKICLNANADIMWLVVAPVVEDLQHIILHHCVFVEPSF